MSSSTQKDAATAVLQGKAPSFKDGVSGRSWDDWFAQVRADLASVECWEYVKPLAEVLQWRREVEAELRAEAKEAKEAGRRNRAEADGKQEGKDQDLTPVQRRKIMARRAQIFMWLYKGLEYGAASERIVRHLVREEQLRPEELLRMLW